MPDETLDRLVQNGCFAADHAAFDPTNQGITAAEMTRRQLRAALEMLIGNGLIRVLPLDEWPEYIVMDPPFTLPESLLLNDGPEGDGEASG